MTNLRYESCTLLAYNNCKRAVQTVSWLPWRKAILRRTCVPQWEGTMILAMPWLEIRYRTIRAKPSPAPSEYTKYSRKKTIPRILQRDARPGCDLTYHALLVLRFVRIHVSGLENKPGKEKFLYKDIAVKSRRQQKFRADNEEMYRNVVERRARNWKWRQARRKLRAIYCPFLTSCGLVAYPARRWSATLWTRHLGPR